MSLAGRLLLAISILTVAATAVLGFAVREAWRRTEEERFQAQFEAALLHVRSDVEDELHELPLLVGPLCEHDPVLDAALIDLRGGRLDSGRRLALSLRIPELARAMRLDELVLFTSGGEVLGAAGGGAAVGAREAALVRGAPDPDRARLRKDPAPAAIEAQCSREKGGTLLALRAARHLSSILTLAGRTQGLSVSLTEPERGGSIVRSMSIPALEGVPVFASRSRTPLLSSLRALDRTVIVLGAATLALALALAVLLSRGLARPIVELSDATRRIATGDPLPVRGRGGRELEELARSFNQAISDLVALRQRLATTERIAARREIARRVAHEIKNPLAPIQAAVETLRRLHARKDPEFDGYFEEATRTVLDEVRRIAHIVQEFTRFARLPAPSPAPMNLVATVADVVRLHSSEDTPVELRSEELKEIVADRDQIVQVVTNLVQNAVEAVTGLPSGRVEVEVGLDGPEMARVVVRDSGPGIPESVRAHLFEPYFTTKPSGTGLGLAIAERIVFEHGGTLVHRDVAGPGGPGPSPRGTEFVVTLPVAGPALLSSPPPEPPSDPTGKSPEDPTSPR